MFFQSILALLTVKLFNFIVCVFVFLKSSQWIMKWWYHWKPFYTGFTWYVGPTSHESSGAVIWFVGVGPTHLHGPYCSHMIRGTHVPRVVAWGPRPTSRLAQWFDSWVWVPHTFYGSHCSHMIRGTHVPRLVAWDPRTTSRLAQWCVGHVMRGSHTSSHACWRLPI